MKNSKEYSKKVQKLYRSLKSKYPKVKKVTYDEPTDALVYAIVTEKMSEKATRSAIKRFAGYFINLNDLRVSRAEEIVEVLGADSSVTRDIASALTRALGAVFYKYNTVSLKALKKIGIRPARQILEKTDGVSHFAISYCVLTSLQGHAIPLTKKMIEFLRSNQLVDANAKVQEIRNRKTTYPIEGFLARAISAENAYEFYALLRRQSEARKARKKKKTARKVKVKAKTKKETKKTKR